MSSPRHLLITGAGRGIGAATARRAAREGYRVCVNYLANDAAAGAVVADIRAAGGEAVALRADVSRADAVQDLFERAAAAFGPVTHLVNNAGVPGRIGRVEALDPAVLVRTFEVNVFAAFHCAQAFVRRASTRHGGVGGAIVNVSSMAAKLGSPGEYVDYAASKGAIDSMTVGLAREVAAEGIRVNAVRPGVIYTEIHASGGEPGRVDRVKGSVPMQRGGTAEEVAQAILWLASDEASYSTGAFIDVSGGR